jgi:hypothetical protein
MAGSMYFQSYQKNLQRVLFAEMVENFQVSNNKRRLSIVGPSYTHDQWLAVQAERRRTAFSSTRPVLE